MNKKLENVMKDAVCTFKRRARGNVRGVDEEASGWLSDNYYILERHARQAADECRYAQRITKGSDLLPGLFERCKEMCEKGVLPDEEKIISFFSESGLNGDAAEYLPLAATCALIDIAANGVKSDSRSGTKRLANAVTSLRRMAETDFDYIAEKLCAAELIFLNDPAGIYPSMDNESKRVYRRVAAKKASVNGKTEKEFAREILGKAEKNSEHIGKYIINRRKGRRNGFLFLIMEIVMPLVCSVAMGIFFSNFAISFLTFFPLWELMRYPIESVSMKYAVPKRFLRLSADSEQVKKAHALITVSAILPSPDKMYELADHLEQLYLSNCTDNIKVCCLADFKGAGMPRKPEDKPMIKAARGAIDRLNSKYGGGFVLAVRPRAYSETQNEFIGRERKRGAITELVRAVKGNTKGFLVFHGDTENITEVKYLIALDGDTQLVFDSARALVSIAEHPLNKPVIEGGRVTKGYGILVPKTENRLQGENTSFFASITAGDTGITAYDSLSAERYQDLFGEAIFSGKGLINVDAYYFLLDSGLPKETILSHDIVESGFLRAGYVPDVQITDGFPQNAGSFYQRLHRWVRGDWQNIRFIFGKNPLNFISRYKMFDNLRRSLTPALCLSAIAGAAVIQGYEGITVAVFAAFALAARNLFTGINSLAHGGFSALSRLYYSKTLPSALKAFAAAFVSVAYSARESFVCLSAAATALWRLFVSKKKLLEWVTAAQSEKQRNMSAMLISCIPAVTASVMLMVFGMPIHRLVGLIILADIPLTLFGGAKYKREKHKITEKQRETLLSHASAMWGFFDEQCGRANNFLPPDNIQFSPVRATAHRTSPTNIGLMLTSFLAARDMGFITSSELYMRLNLSLSTVEKLEKHEGNLLNWYDTETLEPLLPRFVSSVDSGNFLCCLTALKEGLREYAAECRPLEEIIERIEKIIDDTDLAILYNERRRLFHIGISPDNGEKSQSFYDLYMSEARMTAYFAVARRLVSKKHWGAMGRILVGQGRYTGLASWTGTMFEYFMPNLFIPAPEGSLSRESLYFCLQCQRKRAGKKPFGISESGFYAFDGNLNYQYKAHGVQKLGLRHGLDRETVISPYSTFLTLTTAPQISLKNLEKLSKMGMIDKYGFFEAVDFTKGRNSGGFSVIRSYMAHHVGMSFIAVDNMLKNNCMQRRFMSDSFMRGAESILEEKLQSGARVFKDIRTEEIPHIRERVQSKNTVSENPSSFSPEAVCFSNGRMTTCITDYGTGVTLYDGVDVTVNSDDILMRPQGIFAVFTCEKERIPFVSAINSGSNAKYTAEFYKNKAEHAAKANGILLKMKTVLLKQHNCELRTFTVENTGHKKKLSGNLTVYFDPCLEKREAYSAHPAFSKLFLTDEWDEENRCFLFSRRARDGAVPCAVASGFVENTEFDYESDREKVLTTPCGVFSIGEKTDFRGRRGNPDCCCAFSVKIELEPKEKSVYTLAIACEETKEQALNTLLTVRARKKTKKPSINPFYGESVQNAVAGRLLPQVLYPRLNSHKTEKGMACNFKREELWSFGVSGDLPIILVELSAEEDESALISYIKINKILRSCGIATDLVIACRKDEGYAAPIAAEVRRALNREECGLMMGVKGGVHFADLSSHSYEQVCALRFNASFTVPTEKSVNKHEKLTFKPLKTVVGFTDKKNIKTDVSVKNYSFTDGQITIEKKPKTVDIPWTMVLANQCFGTMVSDKALGFTWALNSRENKLTPWYNDTMSDNRGEILFLKYNGVFYDIASLGKAVFTPEKVAWFVSAEGLDFYVEVSVPKRGHAKKCCIEISNVSGSIRDFDLIYFTLPVLGNSRESSGVFFGKQFEKGAVIENSDSPVPGFFCLSCDDKADYVCFSRRDFYEGKLDSVNSEISGDCCVAVGKKINLAAGGKVKLSFYLSWGASEKAAVLMPQVSDFGRRMLNPVKIDFQNRDLDLFFNSFLYSQIKQSRFYGRTGFYQCSGAYGFRDQLQDCLAFIDFEPRITLAHIYRCAAVQFEQGDVLHWWHVIVDKTQKIRGIRTRCSDDMLWLPYACINFYRKTGEMDFLKTEIPYIVGAELKKNEKEHYFSPKRTVYRESLLTHCIKATDYSMKFGPNGLPLIGSCDWNDGFSQIGGKESGESVWLAMFQKLILEGMAEICSKFGMIEKSAEYLSIAEQLENAVENKSWCGDRYARAITQNGELLGAEKDFIDILPQAFAVFAGLGRNGRADSALTTAFKTLFDEEKGVIRLLSPPFEEEERDSVGYIASYPAGIRENAGQYTHAAVWLAMAMFKKGRAQEGKKLLSAINPLSFYSDEEKAAAYRAEPYVLAGDVYYGPDIAGRAGWTHFTGSAAWFYRCVLENQGLYGNSNQCTNAEIGKRHVKPDSLTTQQNRMKNSKNQNKTF